MTKVQKNKAGKGDANIINRKIKSSECVTDLWRTFRIWSSADKGKSTLAIVDPCLSTSANVPATQPSKRAPAASKEKKVAF